MVASEILASKINHSFDHLDADGDGMLTEHDHVLMGQRVAASLGYAPGSDAESRIIEAYVRIWRDLHLPHVPDGGTVISKDHFLESTLALATDPAATQATVGALAEEFLAIADTDGDRQVSLTEFRTFQSGHFPGLSEVEATEAMQESGCIPGPPSMVNCSPPVDAGAAYPELPGAMPVHDVALARCSVRR